MMTNTDIHHVLIDIADYFRECRKNAAQGSSAEVRFDVYVSAILDADKLLEAQSNIIEKYHKADSFLFAHGWRWTDD